MRVIRPANFERRAKRAGLDQDDLSELIRALVERPTVGPVISGTGGARKVRIRLPGRGKSGGARVIDVYTKSDQADLTPQERKLIAKLIRAIESGFEA